MRCEALYIALALLLPLGDALRFPVPKATPCAANEVDAWGWTPRITSVPDVFGLQRRQGHLTQTCGYYGVQALTCGGPNFCIYLYSQPYMGCCPVDGAGSFTSCSVFTTCVNQAQSSTLCGLQGCSAYWGVCGRSSNYPECVTYELIAGRSTYSSFGCDSTSALYLLATIPSTPPTTSSTPTTSPTSSPSTSTPNTSPTSSPSTSTPITTSPSSLPPSSSTASSAGASTSASGPVPTTAPNHHIAAIAGGVVGGVVGLAVIIGAISFVIYRVRKKRDEAAYDDAPEMTGYVQN